MRRLFKPTYAIAFVLLSALPVSAATGTIMAPNPKASFCNAMPLNYPGFLPEYLDMNQDYAKAYQSSADDYYHNYAMYLTSLTSRALLSAERRGKLVAELIKVAESRPITWPLPNDPPVFHEMLVLMPYTVAYAHVKSSMTEDQQKLVVGWIKSRIKLLSKEFSNQRINNRAYHYGAILAAFGYATGESSYSKKAYGIYTTAIKKQRDDGSLMQDSERGGSALHYTNQAIGNLVALAEILQSSGYDTYSYELKGRSLHTIVQFLLAAGSNPALIKGYAGGNPEYSQFQFPGSSPDNQDMGWKRSVIISWAYFYMARFPDHPNTKGLMSISPFLRSGQVGEPDIATGNARCYLGQ
jgi:poly(beta-D-mannuronate) lyase